MPTNESTSRLAATHPATLRWLALIDEHGSQLGALVALFRHVDELERLKRAVRERGWSPEILGSEAHVV